MPANLQAHLRFGFQSALLVVAALVISGQALAQQAQCGPRADLVKFLGEKYHEQVVAAGLINEGALLELAMSGGGQTWTFFRTDAKGVSCLLTSGQAWTHVATEPEGAQT